MASNKESVDNQRLGSFYERPNLKKYGTMKQLTQAFGGDGGDGFFGSPDDGIQPGNPKGSARADSDFIAIDTD